MRHDSKLHREEEFNQGGTVFRNNALMVTYSTTNYRKILLEMYVKIIHNLW